jgi:hypothetical protein
MQLTVANRFPTQLFNIALHNIEIVLIPLGVSKPADITVVRLYADYILS